MEYVYLSPHLDDVALSCGGLVWEQARQGRRVSIWTICAGDPPDAPLSPFAQSLHARWQTGPNAAIQRRQEDIESCRILGAAAWHWEIPDCIYRINPATGRAIYDTEEALFGDLDPAESALVEQLAKRINESLPADGFLVSPLTLGGHVDHRLVRRAAERTGRRLRYYADYPYVVRNTNRSGDGGMAGWKEKVFPVSEQALEAWTQAVAAHASQISTFWPDLEAMREAIRNYCRQNGGAPLWISV